MIPRTRAVSLDYFLIGISTPWNFPKDVEILTELEFCQLILELRPSFVKFCICVDCDRCSVLLWRRCDTLCTSGFVDVMFSHNGPCGALCAVISGEWSRRNYCIDSYQILLNYIKTKQCRQSRLSAMALLVIM